MKAATVAVALSPRATVVALVGARADILARYEDETPGTDSARALLERALSDARARGLALGGVGVTSYEGPDGTAPLALAAERAGLPFGAARFGDALLRGEWRRGSIPAGGSAVLFDADALRLSLLLDGHIHAGARGMAGDLSHLGLDRTGAVRCACGRAGCLAPLLQAGDEAPAPPLPAGMSRPSHRRGWLTVAAILIVNVFNPTVLIMHGAGLSDPESLPWFAEAVRRGVLAPTAAGLDGIVLAHPDSPLLGAAAIVPAR